jgi:hypothetical protein
MTDFVHWYALRDAGEHAPAGPGVLQIKIPAGLLTYPTGKSAMVHYASSQNLQEEVTRLAAEHAELDFLCRHQSSEQPAVLLDFVQTQFLRRFGTAPSWPTDTKSIAPRTS